MSLVAQSGFDYGRLEREAQQALRQHAQRLGELGQGAAEGLWKMGEILADAQDRLASYGNGTFLRWAKNEAGLKRAAVYRLIYIYRAFDFPNLGQTTIARSALHALSEPSTPQEARDEALWRAERGEVISHAKAQAIVRQYRILNPAYPPLPSLPPLPPSPEYTAFEKETLMPFLHDAGDQDAPQVLSGQSEELREASPEQMERARDNLRQAVIEAVSKASSTIPAGALETCTERILAIFAQGNSSIAISARFGAALAQGPKTLSDLTGLCIWACGESLDLMERDVYLRWRKRALRILDSMTYCGGLPLYEHELSSGQLCYSLNEKTGERF